MKETSSSPQSSLAKPGNDLDERIVGLTPAKRALLELQLKQKSSGTSLCARFPDLGPTVGHADDDSCAKHYEHLRRLGGGREAELHCGKHVLAPEAIRGFRRCFGDATSSLLSPLTGTPDCD